LGLKENIKAVKEEISTEEQFLEGMIKSERFFNRNKKYIISALVLLALGAGGYAINDVMASQRLKVSNAAYQALLKDANNSAALETLKAKNPKLYAMYTFETALAKGDIEVLTQVSLSKDNPILADLATYQLSQLDANKSPKGELLSGMVLLQEGYELLKEKKVEEARLKFAQIETNSPLKQIAKNLEHYQGLK
jgi:predicted negative regulator of RcsB-dependent stress response